VKFAAAWPLTLFATAMLPAAGAERWPVGVAGSGTTIEARIVDGADGAERTVVLIGGLAGDTDSARIVQKEVEDYERTPRARRPFRLAAIPLANPDGTRLMFPPRGTAYQENPESHTLWRWVALQAPDLVLLAGNADYGLARAYSASRVAGIGRIPARRVEANEGLLQSVPRPLPPSEAAQELARRVARTPAQLAAELGEVYGHTFDTGMYQEGLALVVRLRMGHLREAAELAEPFATGSKDPMGARPTSLHQAGHLVYAELAERTKDERYLRMVRRAADEGFTEDGALKEAMPYHNEMSDSVFMGTAIVARAGRLTGENRYFDMAARHLAFMNRLVLREDGLYRHSPLTDAAWSRANAFPALGYALTLSDVPGEHPEFGRIKQEYRNHMAALMKFQTPDGMWRLVIDHPETYGETSATAMIGFAMLRGIRRGWLPEEEFRPAVDRAWHGVLARTSSDGEFIDVSESTNKQPTLEIYLKRAAILGRDARAGSMALLFAAEMAGLD
jgi:rhamnogalacturonyl hydrolase YesR